MGSEMCIRDRLKRVQTLAIDLLDETRAFKVRRLRDELRAQADKSLEEIERLHGTSWDPMNRSRAWRPHHQVTFSEVLSDSKHRETTGYDAYPAFVREAAWEWRFRSNGKIGRQDSEYFAFVEKAKEYARVTREGARHSSFSGVLPSSPSQAKEEREADETIESVVRSGSVGDEW